MLSMVLKANSPHAFGSNVQVSEPSLAHTSTVNPEGNSLNIAWKLLDVSFKLKLLCYPQRALS